MTIYKTSPMHDLQCYFQTRNSYPYMYAAATGAACLYKCSATEAHLAGSFTDAFDWSIIEWNRDNIFEHLSQRNVPNGDFTGVTLAYKDARDANVVPIDSFLFDWQDWSYLRIFTGKNIEPYKVKLTDYATAGPGGAAASITFTLSGSKTVGDNICITAMGENYVAQVAAGGTTSRMFDYFLTAYGSQYGMIVNGVTYAYNPTAGNSTDAATTIAGLINADSGCAVTATSTANHLTITSKTTAPATFNVSQINNGTTSGPYSMSAAASPTDFSDITAQLATSPGALVSKWFTFTAAGNTLKLTSKFAGTSGNRLSVRSVTDSTTASFNTSALVYLTGGVSPDYWQITLPFDSLMGTFGIGSTTKVSVPVTDVRAMRWTFSGNPCLTTAFVKQDYKVHLTDWTVTGGANAVNKYARHNSLFIDDTDPGIKYTGFWPTDTGNYAGGTIRYADSSTAFATVTYTQNEPHTLYMGSRYLAIAGIVTVTVDAGTPQSFDLYIPLNAISEDRLCRLKIGTFAGGTHTVKIQVTGTTNPSSGGFRIFFDYLQAAVLGDVQAQTKMFPNVTLATDWDTEHCLANSPDRIVWNLRNLGLTGRANHYIGALKWYNLTATGGSMASASVAFTGAAVAGETVKVTIDGFDFLRTILSGEVLADVVKSFAAQMSGGSTSVWATASGSTLTINARRKSGENLEPNNITVAVTNSAGMTLSPSGTTLSGGTAYYWVTDITSTPVVNSATLEWVTGYCTALNSFGMSVVCAFSQELGHEPQGSSMAAKFSDGTACYLNTPALMCCFSPSVRDYMKQAFDAVAQRMSVAGVAPYLQFGETQWWYFANKYDYTVTTNYGLVTASSMPFYDSYTTGQFTSRYGGTMHVFVNGNDGTPAKTAAQVKAAYPNESALLPALIGEYTSAIQSYVKVATPDCKFEALYPLDVNEAGVPNVMNQPPASAWGPGGMDAMKCEGFGYLFARDLEKVKTLITYPRVVRGFARKNSHVLLGCYDPHDPFERGVMFAGNEGIGDCVLWAFDQFSMRSHRVPIYSGDRRVEYNTWGSGVASATG